MLNSKKSSKNVSDNSRQSPTVNIISEGTKLKGDLNSDSDIRVAGTVEGEARSKGKIIITANGNINGNLDSADADIAGKIDGEVKVSNKLTLRASAVIDGNIYTKTLIVEEGAQINGSCRMGSDAKSYSSSKETEKSGTSS
ncbi:bactofilin family protein [Gracilimonas sp. Q87]|uniref:bactofilin family protein n=1 Tax=Gracilimonas sp. Q87 TaxID=3384766 RepID=UPI0039845C27